MSRHIQIESVQDYNTMYGYPTLHPLVSVIDFSKTILKRDKNAISIQFDFYGVFLKQGKRCTLYYGRNKYDYQDGTLVFVAPGQIVKIYMTDEEDEKDILKGYSLLFHPDIIRGTSLGSNIKDYHFFSYEIFEALHISEQERKLIIDSFKNINNIIKTAVDKHSKKLITTSIELVLDYCLRFYDRQFLTREIVNKTIVQRFDHLLEECFSSNLSDPINLPNVAYCAKQLHLSSNYFGDLIKKETGYSAKDYIQNKLIDIAKNRLYQQDKSVSEIAYELGFKYPQHFTRLFKQRTGKSPSEFKNLN